MAAAPPTSTASPVDAPVAGSPGAGGAGGAANPGAGGGGGTSCAGSGSKVEIVSVSGPFAAHPVADVNPGGRPPAVEFQYA